MVAKGLNVGDTFEDGNRVFVVREVCSDGTYRSALYVPPEPEVPKPRKTK